MWEKLKEVWAGLLLILALSWVMFHLVLIKIQGIVRIYEGNDVVLWVELILTSLLIILAIERFFKDIKRR